LRRAELGVARTSRYFGRSKMNFVSLVLHGMRAVIVFSEAVFTRLMIMFLGMTAAAVLSISTAITLRVMGAATPGWLTTVTGFSLLLFVQTGLVTLVALLLTGMTQGLGPREILKRARGFVASVDRIAGGRTRGPRVEGEAAHRND